MRKIKLIFASAAVFGGLTAAAASAMPIAPVTADAAAKIEQVRYVCGPYRCWWQPNYYGYGYGYGYGYYPRYGYRYGYPRRHYYRHYRRPYYGGWGYGPYW